MDVLLDFDEKTIEENILFLKEELKLDFIINLKKYDEKILKEYKQKKLLDKIIIKEYNINTEEKSINFLIYEGIYFDKNNYDKSKSLGGNFLKALNCENMSLEGLRSIIEKYSFNIIFNFNYKSTKNYTHNPNNSLNESIIQLLKKKNVFLIIDKNVLEDYNVLSTTIFNSKILKKKKMKVLFSTLAKKVYECKNYYDIKSLAVLLFDEKTAKENKKNYFEITNYTFYNEYSIKIERKKEKIKRTIKTIKKEEKKQH